MRRLILLASVMSLVLSAAMASASSLVYSPESITLTIPAGEEKKVPVKISIDNPKPSTYYLFYVDGVVNGNLPLSWLSSLPASLFLFDNSGGSAVLTVRVPAGTPSGVYSGSLFARAMASHDISLPGGGIRLDITVPSLCSGIPEITVNSVEPNVLWPPNHSLTQVLVTGTVSMPKGCVLSEAGYAIDDEYGVYSGVHVLQVQPGGNFTAVLPLEAMRLGQDKDGRHYTVTFYGKNQAGTGTSLSQTIVVPHDQSQKK